MNTRRLLPRQRMRLDLISFAYKKGIPPEADMVLDVRFLPNPYFVDELQPLTGENPGVQKFLLERPETQAFLDHLFPFVNFLLPHYQAEGKTHLTLAIGCTGGQHRSVVIATVLDQHRVETTIRSPSPIAICRGAPGEQTWSAS